MSIVATINDNQVAARFTGSVNIDADTVSMLADFASTTPGKGAALVATKQAFTGAVARTQADKNADVISVRDAGAVGDGDTPDTEAVQALVTAVGTYGGDLGKAGYLPSGLYPLDATITPQSYSRIHGDGPHQSVLRNDVVPLPDDPAFTAAGSLTFATFENIGARGQKSFLDVAGTTDHNTYRNLAVVGMADAGFRFRTNCQTSLFDRVLFETCAYGVVCEGTTFNRNTFREPEFKNLTEASFDLRGSEDLTIIGGRFEGSGDADKSVFLLADTQEITLLGGYFEGCHKTLVTWSGTQAGTMTFNGTHFSFFSAGVPFLWDVGAGQLVFINCRSTVAMEVPANSILIGNNENIQVTQGGASFSKYGPRGGQVDIKGVKGTGTTLDADFLTFTRPSADNVSSNQQMVYGKLRLCLSGYTGGFPQSLVKEYEITVEGKTSFNVSLGVAELTAAALDNSSGAFGFTITGTSQSATAITLHVQATGLQTSVENIMSASFEWTGHSYTEGDEFVVTAP